jgi:molybdopterin-guanine dinucleotide biosynthesis protein A
VTDQQSFSSFLGSLATDERDSISNAQLYPLSAGYRPQVRETVEAMIARNELRFKNLFNYIPTRFVDSQELGLQNNQPPPWQGVNTPEEFLGSCSEVQKSDPMAKAEQ